MSEPAASLPELLTAQEVAAILKVDRERVYALKAQIGYVSLGDGTLRFRPEHVFAFIESRTCPPKGDAGTPGSTEP